MFSSMSRCHARFLGLFPIYAGLVVLANTLVFPLVLSPVLAVILDMLALHAFLSCSKANCSPVACRVVPRVYRDILVYPPPCLIDKFAREDRIGVLYTSPGSDWQKLCHIMSIFWMLLVVPRFW